MNYNVYTLGNNAEVVDTKVLYFSSTESAELYRESIRDTTGEILMMEPVA